MMFEPGMHRNAAGRDGQCQAELHAGVLCGGLVFGGQEPHTRAEGDIRQLPVDHPVIDLWRVLAGVVPGRESDQQVTLFESVGPAPGCLIALSTCTKKPGGARLFGD